MTTKTVPPGAGESDATSADALFRPDPGWTEGPSLRDGADPFALLVHRPGEHPAPPSRPGARVPERLNDLRTSLRAARPSTPGGATELFRPDPGRPLPSPQPSPFAEADAASAEARLRRSRSVRTMRIAGVALLIAGLCAIGYVVHAYWLTGSQASEAQERLTAEFEAGQATAAALIENPTVGARWDEAEAASVTAGDSLVFDPPSTTVVEPTDEAPLITQASPAEGSALGRMLIPEIDLDWVIVEGVRPEDLTQGPGHMTWTALPGQPGNTVVSGHRTTYGAPFLALDELEPGNTIIIETGIGIHVYEVVDVIVVDPTDIWVTDQTDGSWLTLTTCHPRNSARQRLIVFARLVEGPNFDTIDQMFDGPWQLPEVWST